MKPGPKPAPKSVHEVEHDGMLRFDTVSTN
jgi:hypothetical protein